MHGSSLHCAVPSTSTGQFHTTCARELCRVRRSHRERSIASAAAVAVLLAVVNLGLPAQSNVIGSVELYGVRSVSPDEIRRLIGLSPGDAVPADTRALEARLRGLRGVSDAEISAVCCDEGRHTIYIGVQEGQSALQVKPEPSGFVPMPDEVVRAETEFMAALDEAFQSGQVEEDHSAGHALMKHPRARAVQERFIDLAMLYEDSLRLILRESRFPMQRALAAQVLGYLPDKRVAVEALAYALQDPSPAVRNDAARALWVIADYAQNKPEIGAAISVDPLVAMLNSLVWTDRNKASHVLMALSASRDSSLLARLDAEARPALEEMAAWRTQHALAPFLILGRIAGKLDAQIFEEWQKRERRP